MEEFVIVFCQHHHTEVKDTYADQFSSLKDIQHSADLGHQWLGSCTNSMGHSLIADNCVTLCGLINSIESRSTSCFCAGRVWPCSRRGSNVWPTNGYGRLAVESSWGNYLCPLPRIGSNSYLGVANCCCCEAATHKGEWTKPESKAAWNKSFSSTLVQTEFLFQKNPDSLHRKSNIFFHNIVLQSSCKQCGAY